MANMINEHLSRARAYIMSRMINAAKRWLHKATEVFIIKTEYCNILWYTQAILLHDVYHFKRSIIIDGKDGIRTLRKVEQVKCIIF